MEDPKRNGHISLATNGGSRFTPKRHPVPRCWAGWGAPSPRPSL